MKFGIFVILLIALASIANAQSPVKRSVESPDAPKVAGAPYSQAIIANGFVFAAGQIGTDPKTGSLVEGFEAQTDQVLKNIAAVLKASGSSMEGVVKATVFLADMNDFAKMNEIYSKHFKAPFPARSTVQVARLPRDARIEIEVVAIVKADKPGEKVQDKK
ncbi:RidA family protein [Leptolyngbya sp. 7M]|uniref:RidA family protein n=1 Tax=Leptolyngbya sp. 7M TaxID=2812896 RepID=UPI001B8D0811|nr:RidA family protein [Leptolyngbya sp. 7M]QYO66079.1 RidA family protein [Leptolyngbya sp. 7M]